MGRLTCQTRGKQQGVQECSRHIACRVAERLFAYAVILRIDVQSQYNIRKPIVSYQSMEREAVPQIMSESIVGALVNVLDTVGAPVDPQHAQSPR